MYYFAVMKDARARWFVESGVSPGTALVLLCLPNTIKGPVIKKKKAVFKPESRLIYSFLNRGRRDSVQAFIHSCALSVHLCCYCLAAWQLRFKCSEEFPHRFTYQRFVYSRTERFQKEGISSLLLSSSAVTALHSLFMSVRHQHTGRFIFIYLFFSS